MLFTPEHEELRRSLQKFIAGEINPHVDEWEEAGIFPFIDVRVDLSGDEFLQAAAQLLMLGRE